LKANKVTLELPLKDIHKQKDYLEQRSKEQVESTTWNNVGRQPKSIPFQTHKYTRNPAEINHLVTVYKSMEDKAVRRLQEMKDIMHSQFGNSVFQHFEKRHKGILESHSTWRAFYDTEYDQETEEWFIADSLPEKEGFLKPGFKEFIEFDPTNAPSDSTIHEEPTK